MTGKGLVAFARTKLGTNYVYGCKGEVLTKERYTQLKGLYGSAVWDSDEKKVGTVCVDCSGLISWYTKKVLGSYTLRVQAKEENPIATIKEAPQGALVWMRGHVGIYTGQRDGVPYYIAADGSAYGVREVPLSCNKFTHWLLMPWMQYEEVEAQMTTEEAKAVVREKLGFDENTMLYLEMYRYGDALIKRIAEAVA